MLAVLIGHAIRPSPWPDEEITVRWMHTASRPAFSLPIRAYANCLVLLAILDELHVSIFAAPSSKRVSSFGRLASMPGQSTTHHRVRLAVDSLARFGMMINHLHSDRAVMPR